MVAEPVKNQEIAEQKTPCGCESCVCRKPIDAKTGFEVSEDFQRFRQKNDVFNRTMWDDELHSERVINFYKSYHTDQAEFRKTDGFTHLDYALRNASWYIADFTADLLEESHDRKEGFLDTYTMFREGAKVRLETLSPAEMSDNVKRAGRFLGADLIGICEYDERWVYSHNYSRNHDIEKPIDLPEDLPFVVVIANQMDRSAIQTVPSALSGAATGQGYSEDIISALAIAQYIRNLGYRAVASLNDTALGIPLAVQAGLGQYGRHGLLITPEYGPRVRIAKIFTDLPLEPDEPIDFGVTEFCNICQRCSDNCPPRALPFGPPEKKAYSQSNFKGIKKWTTIAERCFGFWVNVNTDCSICIRVCCYNRDYSRWSAKVWRWLAKGRFRRLALWLDNRLEHGKRASPTAWWRGA